MPFSRSHCAFALVALLFASLSGCGKGNFGQGAPPTSTPAQTPGAVLSPTALTFGTLTGTTSPAQTITLSNTGSAPLAITSISLSGSGAANFAVSNGCTSTLAAGATCLVGVTFQSASAGTSAATLTVADSALGSPQGATLTGTATPIPVPMVSLSATALAFSAFTGNTSAAQTVTVTNTGAAALNISGVTITGAGALSFLQTNTCATAVAAGASCVVSVAFKPGTAGSFPATLSIADSATNSPQTVALSGAATLAAPVVSVSPASLTFSAPTGTTTAGQAVTVTNTGNAALLITGVSLSGSGASSFAQTNTCPASLAVGFTCSVTVTFSPTATGTLSASLNLADNATGSPQGIALTGTGVFPVALVTPSSLTFTGIVGGVSTQKNIAVTNTGPMPLNVTSGTLGGANPGQFSISNNCTAPVPSGLSCAFLVSFTPTAPGTFTAVVSIADDAPNSPQAVTVSGTAIAGTPALTLTPGTLSFSQLAGSTSSAQSVSVFNTGNTVVNFSSIALNGANPGVFMLNSACAATLNPGTGCNLAVLFKPIVAGSYSASIQLIDNVPTSPQTVTLTGTGLPPAKPAITLSPSTLSFTALAETTTAPQSVTLTNTGNATLNLASLTLTGTNAAAFAQTNNCSATVAPQASCTLTFTFTPSLAANFTAALALTSDAPATTLPLTGTGTGTLTINTASSTDWILTNGAIRLDFNPNTGNIFSVHLVGYPDEMVDVYTTSAGQPRGLYSGNVGGGAGPVTFGYTQNGNTYIDFWSQIGSSSTNFASEAQHYILTANDTGFHGYYVLNHSATDIAGGLGQQQYIFRVNTSLFDTMYLNDSGLQNLGPVSVQLPSTAVTGNTDPGRQVQNACVDITGLAMPPSWTRNFATKYDFSSYEYLHKAHGLYGSKYGSWAVLPSQENMIGGPSKQDLIFTENIVIVESLSSHYVLNIGWNQPQGTAATKLFGPAYFHFNAVSAALPTPAAMFAESQRFVPAFNFLYDNEAQLLALGHVASSARGTVAPVIANGGSPTANTAWTTLGDNATNVQQTTYGRQYFVNNNAAGTTPLTGVVPGTYRLSHYVLGQWGELRANNIVVAANQTTSLPLKFTPENFGSAAPIWTIGVADRSAHEFLHGHDAAGNDLRNYPGAYNYWADFAANKGAQIFYATAVGSTPQTTDLNQLNYNQWGLFDPGLFGGVYNPADDTTDGYKYIVPAYVGDPSTVKVPPTTIHFTTTAAQQAQGQFATLSVGVAAAEASVIATLNGHQLIYHYVDASDAVVRSGVSGFYQWGALQFLSSYLNAPGADNVLTLSVSQNTGVELDALRFEITNQSADPAITGWNDYGFAYGNSYTYQNDALPNNGK